MAEPGRPLFKTGPWSHFVDALWSGLMDRGRMSDFSIERILSPQLGPRPQVAEASHDGCLQRLPGGFRLDLGYIGSAAPVPCCQRYRGTGFGQMCCPCGSGFHRPDFHHCAGVCVHFGGRDSAEARLCAGFHLCQQPGAAPAPHPQKTRMRTVFTDSQTRQLEALFELSDYPPVEARAEIARRTCLSEETVRVWFKNRRARRKRQSVHPGAGSPPADNERTGHRPKDLLT